MPVKLTLEDRFWSKVDRSGGPDACWPYIEFLLPKGYGLFRMPRGHRPEKMLAHRVAWQMQTGLPPRKEQRICHDCDNPPCCNPGHLFIGSEADNSRDKAVKGRGTRGALPFGVARQSGKTQPRFTSALRQDGRFIYLGTFPTIQQAHFVAMEFRIRRDLDRLKAMGY